ncbi:hypothetical protein GQ42DRAFT_163395, partial [Ramicandelaber brevisporus]
MKVTSVLAVVCALFVVAAVATPEPHKKKGRFGKRLGAFAKRFRPPVPAAAPAFAPAVEPAAA